MRKRILLAFAWLFFTNAANAQLVTPTVPTSPITGVIGGGAGLTTAQQQTIAAASSTATAANTAAASADSAVTNLTATFTAYESTVASTYLKQGADASASIVTANGDAANAMPLSTFASNVYNIAMHGAKGDAVTDNAAMTAAISYATLNPNTDIHIPANINGKPWQFSAVQLFQFRLPSNTCLTGGGSKITSIAWNDYNTSGYYLFGNQVDSGTNRGENMCFSGLKFIGTWTTLAPGGANDSFTEAGGTALSIGGVDNLYINDVEADYSRYYGFAVTNSTLVTLNDDTVYWSFADGIALEGVAALLTKGMRIYHTVDDCYSDHQRSDQNSTRRTLLIFGTYCKDTGPIDIIGAFQGTLTDTVMDSPKNGGLSLVTTAPNQNPPSTEGNSSEGAFSVVNFNVFNLMDRSSFNNYGGGNTAINIADNSTRAGNLASVPGVSTSGITTIPDPYPQTLNNNPSSTTPIRPQFQLLFDNIHVTRTYPATNGSYTAPGASTPSFPNWESLGETPIAGTSALYNPSLPESALQGGCLTITNGDIQGLYVNNFSCSGMGYFANIVNTSATGKFEDFHFSNIHLYDLSQFGIAWDIANGATLDLTVDNLDANMDPYDKNPQRGGSGNWNSISGCSGVVYCKGGSSGHVLIRNGTIRNAAEDINVDTTDPTTGVLIGPGNYDYAQIAVFNAFSGNQNFGVGFVHPGFHIIAIDAIPGDANYNNVLYVEPTEGTAMPTTGTWHQGDVFKNLLPTASTPTAYWLRVTNGTGNTLGTDWIAK